MGLILLYLHQFKNCFNWDEYVAIVSALALPPAIFSSKISEKFTEISSLFLSGTIALYINQNRVNFKCPIRVNIRHLPSKRNPSRHLKFFSVDLIWDFLLGKQLFSTINLIRQSLDLASLIPLFVLKLMQLVMKALFSARINFSLVTNFARQNKTRTFLKNSQMPKRRPENGDQTEGRRFLTGFLEMFSTTLKEGGV